MSSSHHPPLDAWDPIEPVELAGLLRSARFFWCLAGGRALAQFVGRDERAHADTDVLALRDELPLWYEHLTDWRFWLADPPGELRSWELELPVPDRVRDVWLQPPAKEVFALQLMMVQLEGDEWVLRRQPAVRGPFETFATEYGGIPCVRPEIQLAHKAHAVRPQDQHDFERVLPKLDSKARATLRRWLAAVVPAEHPWRRALETDSSC